MNNQFRRSAPNGIYLLVIFLKYYWVNWIIYKVPYYKTASSVYPYAGNQYALVNRTTNPASVIITVSFHFFNCFFSILNYWLCFQALQIW